MNKLHKYTFSYSHWKNATVTVRSKTVEEAREKACGTMDARYEMMDKEPPVAWTLRLLRIDDVSV